jgi:hypothetical protein
MRECQMQLSGPWPPYHFVHKLTRGAHQQAQPAAAAPGLPVVPDAAPMVPILEPVTVLI